MVIKCPVADTMCSMTMCRVAGSCMRKATPAAQPGCNSPKDSGAKDKSPELAMKADGDKNRVDLLPIGPLEAIAEILTFGANKYSDNNWRNGFKWSRLIGALLRHVFAWSRGEACDPETGKSHLAHAGCCILFLLEHEQRKLGTDDRYKY